jgi:hypothetical protein
MERWEVMIPSMVERLVSMIQLLLDHVDYTDGACGPTEMVGAVLPTVVIKRAKDLMIEAEESI